MSTNLTRRRLLKTTGLAIALIPLVGMSRQARASTNAELRARLQYQDTPKDDKNCSSCLEFIPGKTDKDPGGCKKIPGDDEIAPNGYCILWNTL